MNRTLPFALAFASALAAPCLVAQAPAATSAAAVAPQAVPAKIAIIAFEQGATATNEGQRVVADLQKKYEPQKNKLESQGAEVQSLQKQAQALPANTSDEERASRYKVIDTKEKALQRDTEDASNAYQGELQEGLSKVAQKFFQTATRYAQDNGFTLVLNVGGNQQAPSPVLWALPSTDITQAAVNAYNASSGIAAPPPSAPTPNRRPAPAATPHK